MNGWMDEMNGRTTDSLYFLFLFFPRGVEFPLQKLRTKPDTTPMGLTRLIPAPSRPSSLLLPVRGRTEGLTFTVPEREVRRGFRRRFIHPSIHPFERRKEEDKKGRPGDGSTRGLQSRNNE